MPSPGSDPLPQPKYWNVWWALALLAAAVGIISLLLEAVGVFRDLGLVLTGISLFATILFGLAATTRNAVSTLHIELSRLRMDLLASLARIEDILERRLP